MKILRIFLFPFSIVYWIITSVRNFLFDKGILKSYEFDIPIIAVGNLSVGGTGKTPQIEYLIRLLTPNYKIATLSRGYKRKSEGFILANQTSTADILGDEPFQMFQKFPNIQVAVDADRKNGIEQLLSQNEKPEVILLDDAFQHRKVKAGFYILLTSYNDLFCDDYLLPTGNLRESRSGAKRANVIIVTKCPKTISEKEQNEIKEKLMRFLSRFQERDQNDKENGVFFTSVDYDENVYNETESKLVTDLQSINKLLIAGIAKPKPFFDYLKNESDEVLEFPDHHHFDKNDIEVIKEKSKDKIIITTEKDYVRLKNHNLTNLYFLPIKSNCISNNEDFDDKILEFVKLFRK